MIAEEIIPNITTWSMCCTLATGCTGIKHPVDYVTESLEGIAGQLDEDTDVSVRSNVAIDGAKKTVEAILNGPRAFRGQIKNAATELLNDKEVYQPRTVEKDTLEFLSLSFRNEGCGPHYPRSLPELFSREGSTAAIITYNRELTLSERLVAVSPTNPSARKVWGPGVKAL